MSSQEYDWGDLRSEAADHFGEYPGPALEERILAVFKDHPKLVADAITNVETRYDEGKIRSPWIIVTKRLEDELKRAGEARRIRAVEKVDKNAAIGQAERDIRRVWYTHIYPDHVLDELFGKDGPLAQWADDEQLQAEMLEVWQQRREQVGWA